MMLQGMMLLLLGAGAAWAQSLGDPDLSVMVQLQTQYGWGAAFGWPANTNPCPGVGSNWAGVACDGGRIDSLVLPCGAIKLNQRIPPPLGALTALRELNVRQCGLFGPIANTLQTLTRLTRLRLDGNSLSGPIPGYLSTRPLVLLYLNGNRLTGAIPAQANSCIVVTRLTANFLTAAPADWTLFNRQMGGNCMATLPASCAANGNQCPNAPTGTNLCTPQRLACPSLLTITRVSGDGQRTQINTPFANPLQVRVTDVGGSPVGNTLVTFSGPGIVTITALTDSGGMASTPITANGVVGGNTVTASIGTGMVTFGLTAGSAATCSPTINVTSNADSGPGTLRQALADICPGGTIDLADMLPVKAIRLANTSAGRLYLGLDVTVEGRGTVIHGNAATRAVFMQTGYVKLKHLSLNDGVAAGGGSQYGGPGAGMGGAVFQNGGTLTLMGVIMLANTARGGQPDSSGLLTGGGFGPNGSGGDLGGTGGPADGAGGIADQAGGPGGFGAGGGQGLAFDPPGSYVWGGIGGFGGSYGRVAFAANPSTGAAAPNGVEGFGGGWGSGEGGAGFGGAIFVRSGTLNLSDVIFTANIASGGPTAQGKGAALFLYKGAILNQRNAFFAGNVAPQAGVGGQNYTDDDTYYPGSLCPGTDNNDTCGVISGNALTVSVTGTGSVTDSNGLIDCGQQCTALYQGATTLIATPGQGQVFQSWGGACSGSGSCVVPMSAATSVTATFTPATLPTVMLNPQPVTVTAPGVATFTVSATGNPTPTVQWQVSTNGGGSFSDVQGATSTTLSFPTQASQNGYLYRAVFSNSAGPVNTMAAQLTVYFGPSVTLDPSPASVNAGTPVSFTAAANGNPAPTVKWQVSTDGGGSFSDVGGATTTTLSFTAQASQNGNRYRAVFANNVSSATSAAALLNVNKLTPVITWANPAAIAFGSALGSAQLNATANVGGTFVYTPPAGSVPPVGSNQLNVAFTPTDANYASATKSVSLTVTSSGSAAPRLVVTQTLRRDAQTNDILVTLTIANTGTTAATSVAVTRAAIGSTLATTAVPLNIGTINGNATAQATVRFPASTGAAGATAVLSINGNYTGGTFSSSTRIILP